MSDELTDRSILVEMQKEVERLMLESKGWCQHPYCLSLDLCNNVWSNLSSQGIVVAHQSHTYRTDKAKLANLIDTLRELPLRRPLATYAEALPLIISTSSVDIQAKL